MSNCNCKNRQQAWKTYQQGDSFGFPMVHKVNNTAVDIEEGHTLAVGYFDDYGNKIHTATTNDGIGHIGTGIYAVTVPHEVSVNMVGMVTMEFVVYDQGGNEVDHSENVATLFFDPRQMNNEI